VSPTAVREWVAKSRANPPAADEVATLKKENDQLRQELRRAQQEKEILKKAAAFFAKELR
jgi:transposase-like protein